MCIHLLLLGIKVHAWVAPHHGLLSCRSQPGCPAYLDIGVLCIRLILILPDAVEGPGLMLVAPGALDDLVVQGSWVDTLHREGGQHD